jgi:23S rRNA (guanosine2251-2'-O)-methyltransferase
MKSVLLLFNIQKAGNFGKLIRTANALGVEEICVLGRKKFSTHGHQATQVDTPFRHFYRFCDVWDYYRPLGYDFVAVEIGAEAVSLYEHSFSRNSLFVMGNETQGVSPTILQACDYALYIPQFGVGASLNVNVACGIVLNAFNAQRAQGQRPGHNAVLGQKFIRTT